jgi:3-hydroxybutyryl-CoA dehydratase
MLNVMLGKLRPELLPNVFGPSLRRLSTSSTNNRNGVAINIKMHGNLGVSTGQKLGIGEYAAIERQFSERDVEIFAQVSGDYNPVHLNEEYAKTTRFGGRIVHGMLCSSLFSTLFATRLPGSIYINQTLKFVKPVYIDDILEAKIIVKESKLRTITCQTICSIPGRDNEMVIDGEATVLIPRRTSSEERMDG